MHHDIKPSNIVLDDDLHARLESVITMLQSSTRRGTNAHFHLLWQILKISRR
jgi:serine/threonine protein kinase